MSRTNSSPKSPLVLFAVQSPDQIIPQTYSNIGCVTNENNIPWPVFFNEIIHRKLAQVIFCGGLSEIVSPTCAERIVQIFSVYHKQVGGIYTDTVQTTFNSMKYGVPNSPFFLNGAISGQLFPAATPPDQWGQVGLDRLSQQSIIYHLPEVCINAKY